MVFILSVVAALAADVTLTHQGRLLDGSGAPIQGAATLDLGLYGQVTGGLSLYSQSTPLTLQDGYYTVSLGPIDAGLLAGDVWVDVDVDGVSLGGRAPLGSVPQAAFAQVAATADAVSGVAVDVSDCSDGDVFTYRSATSTMVCEPTPDTGVVVGVTTHVTSGRRVLPITNSIQMESFTVDKKSSTSILMVQGTISGFGNYSGSMQQGWRFGSNPEVLAQSTMYDNTSHSRIFSTSVVMSGIGQVGPQNLVFRYFSQNGSASDRPFVTYNPTSADDARIGSTQSVYVVWEIEP
ncbi:MAG: hypothetical protein ACJAZO_001345 [Myxococcota bacterium]